MRFYVLRAALIVYFSSSCVAISSLPFPLMHLPVTCRRRLGAGSGPVPPRTGSGPSEMFDFMALQINDAWLSLVRGRLQPDDRCVQMFCVVANPPLPLPFPRRWGSITLAVETLRLVSDDAVKILVTRRKYTRFM